MCRPPPSRVLLSADKTAAGNVGQRRGLTVAERYINVLPSSRLCSRKQGGHDGVGGVQARRQISDCHTHLYGRPISASSNVHQTKLGLDHDVVAGPARVRTSLAIARNTRVDETRADLAQGSVIHIVLGQTARKIILNEDIAFCGQLVQDVDALGVLKRQAQRLLVAIDGEEICRLARSL
jgi:hypothetical protein